MFHWNLLEIPETFHKHDRSIDLIRIYFILSDFGKNGHWGIENVSAFKRSFDVKTLNNIFDFHFTPLETSHNYKINSLSSAA